ncbi:MULTISPECIES: tRNA1(Val) (adenine(37)-N6)-methyltransferase [Vibrio]|uniref:tRNA1(Val) (adenine(37)-N6)-methyltransferase n=1 Tax=Vibrio TaxID=662 RepID=UPI002074D31E|nr:MULTISPECIES: methyltransferase [Vibrio]USD32058.1 methyltransferase [Vibrio sp. SCSIO 43186]USD45099.1 methyltransferase [Vibrio sp. SCSIO 43145]USD69181.1 methyltransferase [Vibrio sp. SCSIO 43139]USD96872.1 tRNA (adenosine(37)-N6)-methyltransferase TrmM [Vibrio coralliilyticus]
MKNTKTKTKDFSFKQFKISGGYSGMPVSTDGVLLGAWCDIKQANTILDIGTGTGLLALMCAQRNISATIDAIDIDQHALQAAEDNFTSSPWSSRLTLLEGNVLNFPFGTSYDAIVCNPPYFNSGEHAQSQHRATARHTLTLSHEALLQQCQKLLNADGRAWFVLPETEGRLFISLAETLGWHLASLCEVHTTEKKPVSRLLIELSQHPSNTKVETLIIQDDNGYSDKFIALTKAFYLKM